MWADLESANAPFVNASVESHVRNAKDFNCLFDRAILIFQRGNVPIYNAVTSHLIDLSGIGKPLTADPLISSYVSSYRVLSHLQTTSPFRVRRLTF